MGWGDVEKGYFCACIELFLLRGSTDEEMYGFCLMQGDPLDHDDTNNL